MRCRRRGTDDDAWGWSGELDVGEAAAGKRQRAVLQSERGRLLLVSAEVSADGSGAFCATFFDDPQPPIVLRNHTAADIYFAPELDDEGEEEGEEEWLRLAAGATAHFALPVDDDALLPGAEAAAAGEGEAAAIRVALRADGGGGGGGSFRLAPPRLLKLSALSALVAQEGPTTTVHLLPSVAPSFAAVGVRDGGGDDGGLGVRVSIQRLELSLWEARGHGCAAATAGGPLLHAALTGVECRLLRTRKPSALPAALRPAAAEEGTTESLELSLLGLQIDTHLAAAAFRTVISADAPPASAYVARVLGSGLGARTHDERAAAAAPPVDRRRAADADARVRSAAPR